MTNAIFDPLGRENMSPIELAKTFNIIKANVLVDEFSNFPCFDELANDASHMFFNEHELPAAVIFISHRWLSTSHPDPDGKQLATLKTFLTYVKQLSDLKIRSFLPKLSGKSKTLRRIIFTHGGYQAAYFLGDYNPFDSDNESSTTSLNHEDDVLSKIGIWYDFTCMPQDAAQLASALEHMHELLGASNLISFRQPGDNYDSRAWCAAEVATDPDVERTHFRKICLRMDKIGTSIPTSVLFDQPSYLEGIEKILLLGLEQARSGMQAARAVASFISMVGVDAEDNRDVPLFFVKRKPWIFEGQKEFMVRVMDALDQVSVFDEKEASSTRDFSVDFDLTTEVSNAAKSVGLSSSKQEHIPYASLLILYARHRGVPSLAYLFADCLQRYVRKQTTVLSRYREHRDAYTTRCWYLFEDEEFVGLPSWVEEMQNEPDFLDNRVDIFECRHKQTEVLFSKKCTDCGSIFCDLCMEAASRQAGELVVLAPEMTSCPFKCPHCGSSKLEDI